MKYGVVIFPNSKVSEFADAYRKRYDPQYAMIPPHIKVREPFDLDSNQLDGYISYLEETARRTESFALHFYKFSHFSPTQNIIFMALKHAEPLIQLNQEINKNAENTDAEKYVPFLPVAQELDDDELHDLYSRMKMREVDFVSEIDRIYLVRQIEGDSWEIVSSFSFPSLKASRNRIQ